MDVTTEDIVPPDAGADAPPATEHQLVDVWFDPTKPVIRVEEGDPMGGEPAVSILGAEQGFGGDTPMGVVLLYLLATQPPESQTYVPPGLSIRSAVEAGQPVSVVEFPVEESYESPAQIITLTFDASNRPLHEERTATGQDAMWTTKKITYETDFVDPATLPDGFIEAAPSPGSPIEELSTQVADLAQQGLEVMWLGPTYQGLDFQYLAPETFPAPMASISYLSTSSAGTLQAISLTETAVASWPTVQANLPGLAEIATVGTPVPGLGDKAFLSTAMGTSALVLYQGDTITIIQLDAPAGDARAELIEAAKALRPFGST
jgi:hypothetical protein